MIVRKKNHFSEWRKQQLKEINALLKDANMVAIADISELPASAMLHFRNVLKESNYKVKVVKLRLLRIALKEAKLDNLSDKYASGSVALVVGNENPFKLFGLIKKNASDSSAKEGLIAPDDLIVKAGDTNIPPGPALSDFKVVNIKTQIRNGHIFVADDIVVAKKGDIINSKVANILTKLGIKPIKVLLKLKGAYEKEDKILYDSKILDIDLELVKSKFVKAYQDSYFLALSKAIVTKDTIKPLIVKAFNNAKGLALSQNIVNKETIKDIIGKANRIGTNLKTKVNI